MISVRFLTILKTDRYSMAYAETVRGIYVRLSQLQILLLIERIIIKI